MREIQFREAVCEAMSEEMRLDESIYLMGEEVAEYNGAYKASKGMLDEFGDKRVIDTPISECEKRDPKGLYKKARLGHIKNFTGIDSRYEKPINPDLYLDTDKNNVKTLIKKVITFSKLQIY